MAEREHNIFAAPKWMKFRELLCGRKAGDGPEVGSGRDQQPDHVVRQVKVKQFLFSGKADCSSQQWEFNNNAKTMVSQSLGSFVLDSAELL